MYGCRRYITFSILAIYVFQPILELVNVKGWAGERVNIKVD